MGVTFFRTLQCIANIANSVDPMKLLQRYANTAKTDRQIWERKEDRERMSRAVRVRPAWWCVGQEEIISRQVGDGLVEWCWPLISCWYYELRRPVKRSRSYRWFCCCLATIAATPRMTDNDVWHRVVLSASRHPSRHHDVVVASSSQLLPVDNQLRIAFVVGRRLPGDLVVAGRTSLARGETSSGEDTVPRGRYP